MTVLAGPERESALSGLKDAGWCEADGQDAIAKTFTFDDFPGAIAWMVRVAFEAERMDHHPDWSNSYRKVHVTLSSHDVGGVTRRDVDLARLMEDLC